MDIFSVLKKYSTHDKCLKHLVDVRWNGKPECVFCGADNVTERGKKRKFKKPRQPKLYKTPKYHCNTCNRDFTVLTGTIFEQSKLDLPKWFALITLMLNARKGISAMNIHRDLGITYKTAWYSAMRVRCAMLDQATMLEGIVEMDEVYIVGKPRHRNKGEDNVARLSKVSWDKYDRPYIDKRQFNKGGADKVKVVGMVERGKNGRVALKVQDSLSGEDLLRLLRRYVNTENRKTKVMTDDFKSYKAFDKVIQHYTVNHSEKEYVKHIKGIKESIHTNTIEGVWSIIKNGIRGQYHVLSKKYLPFYLAEAAYKYNRRSSDLNTTAFDETIENAVTDEKCEVNYKPKKYPGFLAYRNKKRKQKPKKSKRVRVLKNKEIKKVK